jgi:hypothetical protein
MEMSSLLALNVDERAICDFLVGLPVLRFFPFAPCRLHHRIPPRDELALFRDFGIDSSFARSSFASARAPFR